MFSYKIITVETEKRYSLSVLGMKAFHKLSTHKIYTQSEQHTTILTF